MNICITGTKIGATGYQLVEAIKQLYSWNASVINILNHGGCVGFDEQIHNIIKIIPTFNNIQLKIHPAKGVDDKYKAKLDMAGCILEDEKLPLERNKIMVDKSDCVLAVPKEFKEVLRSGTWSTIRYAKKQNKPLIIIYPDGSLNLG